MFLLFFRAILIGAKDKECIIIGHMFQGIKCGNRIKYISGMEVSVTSLGGVDYMFFGNDTDIKPKVTKDCSAGSSCLVRTEHTNNAKSENVNVNFSVPITTVTIDKRGCDRLSF